MACGWGRDGLCTPLPLGCGVWIVTDSSTAQTRPPSSPKRCASARPQHEPIADAAGCARRQQDRTRGACWNEGARRPQPPWRCAESCAHPVQAHRALAGRINRRGREDWIYVRGLLGDKRHYPACAAGH
eukprot:851287-Pleurochrysis_carterae.AAC.1